MSKNRLIAIIACGALLVGGVSTSALTSFNTNNHTNQINSKILLSAPANNNQAVVINTNKNPLVLYTAANSNSSIASYLTVGEMLTYQTTSNPNFYKVTVQETGATGYISANNIQIIESGLNQAFNNLNEQGKIINVSSNVRLRTQPDMQGNIISNYKNDTSINILGKQGQWYKVEIGNQTGYMYQEYVGIDSSTVNNNVTTNSNSNNKVTATTNNATTNSSSNNKVTATTNNTTTNSNSNNKVTATTNNATTNSSSNNKVTATTNNATANSSSNNKVTATTNNANNNATASNNTNQIIYNNNLSPNYSLNTIVVKNPTEKNISSDNLNKFIRNWILKGQYKNPVIPTNMATQWSEPWLNKISNNTIMQAFTEANGVNSLAKNITVNEFVKTVNKLNEMTINNVPFTLPEAKKLIINMLQKNGYANPNEITKITYTPGTPGIYNVYTKQSGKNVFWIVAANTGVGKA